jgi:hypothetical protein
MITNATDPSDPNQPYAITTADGTVWGHADSGTGKSPWNGAVYIDVEAPNQGTSDQTASVRLTDGEVATGSSLIPTKSDGTPFGNNLDGTGVDNNGLTIATNAPVYILGNFNADGNVSTTTSATVPDDGKTGASGDASVESPVCIAGDAITILSPDWDDASSLGTIKPSTSHDVEVAAALLTGLTPTTDSANSGGAHNLPRFLESWRNSVAIRGSLVTMFSSKVATEPFSTRYYGAPRRIWGFDQIFSNGNFPPITPKVMSFRRINFSDLSSTDYAAALHKMWPSLY